MIGRILGGYRIVEQVGMGGMATVYKAYDPGTDRYVAIKILPEHYARDATFRARFTREAKAIARLEHPAILPIFAYGEEENVAYLVMRYLPTGTLKARIERGPMSLGEASGVLTQIGDALDYAHEHGILHRDVKPSNVLLDEKGNAYLMDFGIAKMVEATGDLTAGGLLGTPAYMSPEQCQGSAKLTPASDQYALGIVAYEMVTGRVPFLAETPLALVYMHLNDPLPPPRTVRPDLPEAVEKVILKALSKEPAQRFGSCGEMAKAFGRAIEGREALTAASRPVTVTPHDAPTSDAEVAASVARKPVQARRFPAWLAWLVAVVVISGVVGGVLLLRPIQGGQGEAADTAVPETLSAAAPESEVVTAPDTTVPQETVAEPNATTPPASLPTVILTVPPDPTLYDDFNNPAYDGAFNMALWTPPGMLDGTISQENGALVMRQNQENSCMGVGALTYAWFTLDTPTFFQADLMLDPAQHNGAVSLHLGTVRSDGMQDEFTCGVNGEGTSYGVMDCWDRWNLESATSTLNDPPVVEDTYNAPVRPAVELGTWHTVRIEVDPATMTFTYYIDGQMVGFHTPARAEQLRTERFRLALGVCQPTSEAVTSYVDNVRIGAYTP